MKLKLDAAGHAVLQDGHPVYVYDDGTEKPFDAVQTAANIKRLNAEAKGHRERAEAAEAKVSAFDGIDAEAARKALRTIENIDAKKLIDAGEVEKVREQVAKSFGEKLSAAEKRASDLEGKLHGELIGGGFARSKFVTEKLAIPADVAQAFFGKHFAVKEGRVVATDANGAPILSRTNGQPADFDEALESLVSQYPRKESILRATQGSGSGAPSGNGGATGGKTITRQAYDAMPPGDRMSLIQSGTTIV